MRTAEAAPRDPVPPPAGARGAEPPATPVPDAAGRVVFASDAAARLLGATPEGLTARDLARRIELPGGVKTSEDDLPLVRSMRTGAPEWLECNLLRSDARVRVVMRSAALRDGGGSIVGAVASLREAPPCRPCPEARRYKETLFRFADHALDAVIIHRDGRLLHANHAACSLYGYDRPEELVGLPVLDLVPPDARARVARLIAAVVAGTGVPSPMTEERVLRRDGTTAVALVTVLPCFDDEGTTLAVILHDLSEQHRAETERDQLLRAIHDRNRVATEMIQVAPVGIALLRGPELRFELVNAAFQAFAPGFPLLGRPFAEVAPEMPEVIAQLADLLRTRKPLTAIDAPVPIQRNPGGPIEQAFFTFSAVVVEPDSVMAIVVETTEHVRARARIAAMGEESRRLANQYRAVLDHLVEGVVACDADRRVTMINQAARALLARGGVATDLAETAIVPVVPVRRKDETPVLGASLPLPRALAGETVVDEELLVTPVEGRRDLLIRTSAAPIRSGDGRVVGAVLVMADVTEASELERLKDQFIRVAAHELKTPVTILKGYALMLLRAASVSPEHAKALRAIDRGADRIDRIVRDLVDVSRTDLGLLPLRRERVDLVDVASRAVEIIARATTKHRFEIRAASPVLVQGDPERLEQVLERLLDNAVRYSPDGGPVRVVISAAGGDATVEVIDRGVGIPEEKQARIFERFYRAHTDTPHDYGGLGIGLFLCRHIVRAHGGEMTFESRENDGSTFRFSLPRAP